MKLSFYCLILLFSLSKAIAQKDCGFVLDTTRIVNDENISPFLKRLKTDNFEICTSKKQIPKHIIKTLKCLNEGEFSLSELHAKYRNSDVVEDESTPDRGLIFLAKNENTIIIYYGMSPGPGISSKMLLIEFDEKNVIDMWIGTSGGTSNIKTIEDVVGYVSNLVDRNKVVRFNYLYF